MTDAEFVAWARRYLEGVVKLPPGEVAEILKGTREQIEAAVREHAGQRRE